MFSPKACSGFTPPKSAGLFAASSAAVQHGDFLSGVEGAPKSLGVFEFGFYVIPELYTPQGKTNAH